MSYKNAWTFIDEINGAAKEAVATKTIGVLKGGGKLVTPYDKRLIKNFERINKECWIF